MAKKVKEVSGEKMIENAKRGNKLRKAAKAAKMRGNIRSLR